ncbi:MAG: RecQ family ATP-dependent DNA helicase [Oligoflexales bacterium]
MDLTENTELPFFTETSTSKTFSKPELNKALERYFGHKDFRPHQQEVCLAGANGSDLLVVMPTGAGKSLCYQLPGLMRQGTTLVISPLIALMEDQCLQLKQRQFRAERIHSGRSREESRQVCIAYLKGELDFLFIAPERIGVPGFIDFLLKRSPSLIAVDEAHCISQWGHDFRPDYRLLHQRLLPLRPCPIIALTATATPEVQDDIALQLGLKDQRFICGFRRTNIAIEAVDVLPSARIQTVQHCLQEEGRLPAILYAPTRKLTEEYAKQLKNWNAEAYHAGMPAAQRQDIQERFIAGEVDIIVATIAFGMGIDKSNIRTVFHMSLPGTIEGYYQEIGRAGRDGKPSRAILLHSYSDRKTLEYFLNRNYPDIQDLKETLKHIPADGIMAEDLEVTAEQSEHLQRLQHLGGIVFDGHFYQRGEDWEVGYARQKHHRQDQIEKVWSWTKKSQCRMSGLVNHFGDTSDSGENCKTCDYCQPHSTSTAKNIQFTDIDINHMRLIITVLDDGPKATGRLHKDVSLLTKISRSRFEDLINEMKKQNFIETNDRTFTRDEREIHYKQAELTRKGKKTTRSSLKSLYSLDQENGSSTIEKTILRKGASKEIDSTDDMIEKLKKWAKQEADEKNIPIFMVLTRKSMEQLVLKKPRNTEQLEHICGIGPTRANRYGSQILQILNCPL